MHHHLEEPFPEDLEAAIRHVLEQHSVRVNPRTCTWAGLAQVHADWHRQDAGSTPVDDLIGSGEPPLP